MITEWQRGVHTRTHIEGSSRSLLGRITCANPLPPPSGIRIYLDEITRSKPTQWHTCGIWQSCCCLFNSLPLDFHSTTVVDNRREQCFSLMRFSPWLKILAGNYICIKCFRMVHTSMKHFRQSKAQGNFRFEVLLSTLSANMVRPHLEVKFCSLPVFWLKTVKSHHFCLQGSWKEMCLFLNVNFRSRSLHWN